MLPFKVPNSLEEAKEPVANPRDDETLPVRVKEVFLLFDTQNRGVLTIDQVGKLLKKLSGFTNDQVAGFCSDIDRSKDGLVSYKELVDWVQKGGGAMGEQVARAVIRETNKRAVRIKAAFERYDDSGDGLLDLVELKTVLRTLGAFTNQEILNVLADLDSNGDGNISFPEFADWVRRASEIKEAIKAKCILAPSDSDGIEAVFYNFCGPGHADIDGKSFLKLVKDCKLLNRALTDTNVDLIFSDTRVKRKKQRRIDFSAFEGALELVAEKRGSSVGDVRNAMLQCTHPVLRGTKADFVRFHDDIDGQQETTKLATEGLTPKKEEQKRPKKHRMPGQLSLERPATAGAMPVDNTNMWRTFGMDNKAGRCLKRLYTPKTRPSTATKYRWRASGPPAMDTYVTVNTLGVCTEGVRFRRSMCLSDICTDPLAVIPWGASIKAELVAFCWLRIGNRYLPTSLDGVQVMMRWEDPGPPPNLYRSSLSRSSSLPAVGNAERAFDLKGLPSSLIVNFQFDE